MTEDATEDQRRAASRRRRLRATAALAVIGAVALSGCESATVDHVNDRRAAAAVDALAVAPDLTQGAQQHSSQMCAAGAVSPSVEPLVTYAGPGATAIIELVGRARIDGGSTDSAAATIWNRWRDDPRLVDPRWESIGVGEFDCPDGRLYLTMVLRDDAPSIATPADTSQIQRLRSLTRNGWRYTRYRNLAAPCSIGGYQSFVIGTQVGSDDGQTRPLWVKLRGGGAGWFDAEGSPRPTAGNKSEEPFTTQLGYDTAGLMARVKATRKGFRVLIVSMCSHDIYSGSDNGDPFNPNTTPDGDRRPTTGLTATKAAVEYTLGHYPTDDYFLHGTSAGGVGSLAAAWALERQGLPPAGVVSDSGVLNQEWTQWVADHGLNAAGCAQNSEERGLGVLGRIAPELGDPANQPHLLVGSGRLTVPIMHVWNRNDGNVCGAAPMTCPLPNGRSVTMGAANCNHEPLRRAIAALPASAHSANLAVCVEGPSARTPCDRHVVTTVAGGVNRDPAVPSDYQGAILAWVKARLLDD